MGCTAQSFRAWEQREKWKPRRTERCSDKIRPVGVKSIPCPLLEGIPEPGVAGSLLVRGTGAGTRWPPGCSQGQRHPRCFVLTAPGLWCGNWHKMLLGFQLKSLLRWENPAQAPSAPSMNGDVRRAHPRPHRCRQWQRVPKLVSPNEGIYHSRDSEASLLFSA